MFRNSHLTDNACLSKYAHGNAEPTGKFECSVCVSCLHPINSQTIWKESDQMEWINLKNINEYNVFTIEIYAFAEMGRFLSFWKLSPFPWENGFFTFFLLFVLDLGSKGYFAMCCTSTEQKVLPRKNVEPKRKTQGRELQLATQK